MGHYVRLPLLPGNRHGSMDVDMVTIARNNDLFVMVMVMMRLAGDMDVVIVARNNHFLVSVVVVVVVVVMIIVW